MSRLAQEVEENGAPLLGTAAYFYDPIFLEIAAKTTPRPSCLRIGAETTLKRANAASNTRKASTPAQ